MLTLFFVAAVEVRCAVGMGPTVLRDSVRRYALFRVYATRGRKLAHTGWCRGPRWRTLRRRVHRDGEE
jgi:hypothetical protein